MCNIINTIFSKIKKVYQLTIILKIKLMALIAIHKINIFNDITHCQVSWADVYVYNYISLNPNLTNP